MKVILDRARTVNLDEFLARPLFAHLATSSPEGPRDSPVWFLWEEKRLWIIAEHESNSFHERLKEDPRCSLGIVDFRPSEGRVHHVGIRGTAEVVGFDVERAKRLFRKYLGSEERKWPRRFTSTLGDAAGHSFVKLRADTVVARDVSYEPWLPGEA